MKEIDRLINNYFKYVDKKEKYQEIYQESFEDLIVKIKALLLTLSLNDIVQLYLRYVKDLSLFKNSNHEFIFSLLYEAIISKLNTISLMKTLDLYSDIFVSSLDLEEQLESNKNVVKIRNYNLNDEFYLKRHREKYLKTYALELEIYEKNVKLLEVAFNNLDNLQNGILIYIETKLMSLTDEEKGQLIETLNSRIEENSKEMVKRMKLRSNRMLLELQSKFNDVSLGELLSSLDVTSIKHKNYVYDSFKSFIMEKENKK